VSGPGRVRLNLALYVLVLAVAAVAVVVGVAVVKDVREDPAPSSLPVDDAITPVALEEAEPEEQDRLGEVVEAATTQVTAFLNLDYRDPQASFDQVVAGSTGAFRTQFEKSTKDLAQELTKAKSVQESEVLWTGVVAADDDSATVTVAASGTVRNTSTRGKDAARNYRLQLELVNQDGTWLTRDLQFVA
jgi:Mce-associated membrane protein